MPRILTSITRSRGVVQTGGDLGASTRSTKNISGNPGALREAVEDEVRARALLVESSDLGLTVADSRSNLSAEVAVHHSLEHNLDEVTGLALSLPHVASTKGKVRLSWYGALLPRAMKITASAQGASSLGAAVP
jgi:hypothetical protein